MTTTINASNSGGGGLVQTADASGILALQTAGVTAATVDASQNVGIGTSSPGARLDIRSAALGTALQLSDDTNYGVNFIGVSGGLKLAMNGSQTFAIFQSTNERLTIDSSGNVGIGTTSSSAKLEIKAASASQRQLQLTHFNSTDGWYFTADDTGGVLKTSRAGSSGLNGEAMRIDSSGAVLINATSTGSFSAAAKLSVLGVTAEFAAVFRAPDTGNYIVLSCDNPNGQVGKIQTSGSATSFLTSSDYRLKEDIAPMTGALAKVALLKPVTYKWKVDGTAGQGFIAHELQEVVPDCVGGEKDAVTTYINEDGNEATRPAYQGIDTSFLVATLTAAIQEQQALITQQAAAIEALTTRITALEGTPA